MRQFLACCTVVLIPIAAGANHLKTGTLAVNRALAKVRSADAACKSGALSELKNARDTLNLARGKATVETYTKARRAVEDAMDNTTTTCSDQATAAMREALNALQQGLDALASSGAETSPADKRQKERRACWNYKNDWAKVDPGCHVTRDGSYAIGKDVFERVLAKVRQTPDRHGKSAVVEEELGYAKKPFVTCLQLGTLAPLLLHDNDRLEMVKTTAERIVDPQHSHSVTRHIHDPRTRKEAQRVIAEASD